MCEQAHCRDEAANHQWSIPAAFWVIQIVSTEECSSLTQNLMQIHCSTRSVILNATATQYTCSLSGVSHPHWLVQGSRHCSRICIPVHPPWLPSYINVKHTILITLTMAGLFPDRPIMSSSMSHVILKLSVVTCGGCWEWSHYLKTKKKPTTKKKGKNQVSILPFLYKVHLAMAIYLKREGFSF